MSSTCIDSATRGVISTAFLAIAVTLMAGGPLSAEPLDVAGRLLDAEGEPLEGARVQLLASPTAYESGRRLVAGEEPPRAMAEEVTGAGGWFSLRVEPGFYQLRADADGFVPMTADLHPLLASVVLAPARLEAAGDVELLIVDADGAPIGGASLLLRRLEDPPKRRASSTAPPSWRAARRMAKTDAFGRVSVPKSPDERLVVLAAHGSSTGHWIVRRAESSRRLELGPSPMRELRLLTRSGESADLLVEVEAADVWPALSDEQGVVRLPERLAEGSTLVLHSPEGAHHSVRWQGEAEIRLPGLDRFGGTLVDADAGLPLAGAFVWSPPRPGHGLAATSISGRDGSFSLPFFTQATLQRTRAGLPGYRSAYVTFGGETALRPARTIEGRVVDHDDSPVAAVAVELSYLHAIGSGMTAFSDGQGHFSLAPVEQGSAYQATARLAGRPPAVAEVDPLSDRVELRFDLGGSVRGRLVTPDDEPIVGGRLSLYHDVEHGEVRQALGEDDPASAPSTISDADGRFELTPVGAGHHALLARAEGRATEILPGVVLEAGESIDLGDLKLEPSVPLRLATVDEAGDPVPGVAVVVFRLDGSGWRVLNGLGRRLVAELGDHALTDEEGRARLAGFAPGQSVVAEVQHADFVREELRFEVPESGAEVALVMQAQAVLRGRVVDPAGRPVKDARVTVAFSRGSQTRGNSGRTDEHGEFHIDQLPAGEIEIGVDAEGFSYWRREMIIEAGWDPGGMEIILDRGLSLRGRVSSADGLPVSAADLSVRFPAVGSKGAKATRRATTEASGEFSFEGLPAGSLTLVVSHPKHVSLFDSFDLSAETEFREITLEGPTSELLIQIFDSQGEPVGDVELTVRQLGGGLWHQTSQISSQEGYRAAVRRGERYRVVAKHERLGSMVQEIGPVEAALERVELHLQSGARILGRIVDLDRSEVSGVKVFVSEVDELGRGTSLSMSAEVGLDGRFRLEGLSPGRWRVTASLDPSRIRVSREVEIAVAGQEVEIELELGDRGQTLRGRVLHNGLPAVGANIDGVTTGLDGRFELPGRQPGPLSLQVRGPWDRYRWQREHWNGEPITISITTSELAGVVTNPDGTLATGVRVWLGRGSSESWSAHSDAQGHFRFKAQPHGSYSLFARSDAGSARGTVELDGDRRGLALQLEPGVRQALHIERTDGRPVERVRVVALDAAGRQAGREELTASSPGIFQLERIPAGTFRLLIIEDGSAIGSIEATLPGEPLSVLLEPGARLIVRVPALERVVGATAVVRNQAGDLFSPRNFGGTDAFWRLWGGVLRLSDLPAGVWTITIETADGQSFETTVETNGLEPVSHVLE